MTARISSRFPIALVILVASAMPSQGANRPSEPLRLHFHIKNGLILVDGRVDSTPGVFTLDLGETYFRFILNRSYIPLGPGTDLFKMHAESGQVSTMQTHAGLHRILLDGKLAITAETGDATAGPRAVSDDFQHMLKNLDPALLGVVGYAFLKPYDFSIDYANAVVTVYAPGTAPRTTGGVTIKFVPSSPITPFPLAFGDTLIPTVLDTGGWEELKAPEEVWAKLGAGGHVRSTEDEGTDCVTLPGARYGTAASMSPMWTRPSQKKRS
jgi:hypothetical protein